MLINNDQSIKAELIAFGIVLIMFFGLAASWSFENIPANLLVILPAVSLLLLTYATRLSKLSYVEVAPSQDRICVHKVSFFGKRRTETYRLSEFQGVVSFLNNRNINSGVRYNYVELLTKREGKGLVIARFEPAKPDQRFMSLHLAYSESQKAKEIRRFLADSCGMTDLGFAGHRHFREQLPPSKSCA